MSSIEHDKTAYMQATPMQRERVRLLLCDLLCALRAQALSYQTSHWQVSGPEFYGTHLLFQRLYGSVGDQIDQLAEKIVGYLGSEAIDLAHAGEKIAGLLAHWAEVSCHHERGLLSESETQATIKAAYEGIKAAEAMTLGLDDWLMATANAHEENEYLLQQVLADPPSAMKLAAKGDLGVGLKEALWAMRGATGRAVDPQALKIVSWHGGTPVRNSGHLWAKLHGLDLVECSPPPEDAFARDFPLSVKLTPAGKAKLRGLESEREALAERAKARKDLQALVDRLAAKHPQAGLSFGYLGNVSTYGDDRAWYVFSKLSQPGSGGSKSFKWGGQRTDDLPKLWAWAKSNLSRVVQGALQSNDGPYLGPARRWAAGITYEVHVTSEGAIFFEGRMATALKKAREYARKGARGFVKRLKDGKRVSFSEILSARANLAWRMAMETDSGAPTAEDEFFDNPEKREVLEFAESGALSNDSEVAADAAVEDGISVTPSEAVEEAEEAPPTPEEILEEPGAAELSTLNRYQVASTTLSFESWAEALKETT